MSSQYDTSVALPGHAMTVQRREVEGEHWPARVVVCGCGFEGQPRDDLSYTQIDITTHALDRGVLPADTTTYRLVATHAVGDTFVIQEYGATTIHPINQTFLTLTSPDSAWLRAQVQTRPVVVLYRDGQTKQLGEVFRPEAYERAVYHAYVSAGYAMSDGHYAPLLFDSWVQDFRRAPRLPESEQRSYAEALDAYKASLVTP